MDKDPVFKELLTILPDWSARLQAIANKHPQISESQAQSSPSAQPSQQNSRKRAASEHENDGPVLSTTPMVAATTTVIGPHPPRAALPAEKKLEINPIGRSKMLAKPTATKQKFSLIDGPQIYYDGEAQKVLFECWTMLNSRRGLLRKEMMAVRRKKVMTLPAHGFGYDDDSEEEDKEEDEGPKETEEERLEREEEERKRAEEERLKAEREKKAAEILEHIDSCLDKAAKGCESAAFLWLKGDICEGHINFINSRMQEAVARIELEIERAKPVHLPPPATCAPVVEDEGLGSEMETDGDNVRTATTLPPWKMDTTMHDSRVIGVS